MQSKAIEIFFDYIERAMFSIPAFVASSGLIMLIFLLFDSFGGFSMWLISITGGALVSLYVINKVQSSNKDRKFVIEARTAVLALLAFVMVWGIFNSFYNSQHVLSTRDPATYSIAGSWLLKNDNLKIPKETALIDNKNSIFSESAGFRQAPDGGDYVYAQGQHMLPVFLGATGRILSSESLMLKANIIIGMLLLVTIYLFAVQFARPYWALIATIAFGLSMPLIYFSRATYTEPMSVLFLFGGLALLTRSIRTKNYLLSSVGGLIMGAGATVRVDGLLNWLIPAGIVLAIAVSLFFGAKKVRARMYFYHVMAIAGGMSIGTIIGFVDLSLLSPHYFFDIRPKIINELLVIIAFTGFAILLTLLVKLNYVRDRITPWLSKNSKKLGYIFTASFLAFYTFLLSRPLWLQDEAGLKIRNEDGTLGRDADIIIRTYAELTAYWPYWYLGPIIVLLAIVFVIYLVNLYINRPKELDGKHLVLFSAMVIFLITMTVYFIKPQIASDQIWAARRQLTIILPMFVVFGAAGLTLVQKKLFRYYSESAKSIAIVLLTFLIVIVPYITTTPIINVREKTQLGAMQSLCDSISDNAAVLWSGSAARWLLVPSKNYCGLHTVANSDPNNLKESTIERFSQLAISQDKTPYVGIFKSDANMLVSTQLEGAYIEQSEKPVLFSFLEIEHIATSPPKEVNEINWEIVLLPINK